MPLPDNLLKPIPGENPSGVDLRYTPVYDQIKEARRAEDDAPQGEWVHDVKKADFPLVVKLSTDALANKSKDLQIAAWLTEALIKVEGFEGLKQGTQLLHDLNATFWDSVYPQLEDGDSELRASPLQWIGTTMGIPLRSVPLNRAGHSWLDYTESRKIPTEELADSDDKVTARRNALAEGKLPPELFDKSFAETPKAFYAGAEAALDESTKVVESLDTQCREKFGDSSPSFVDLKKTLQEVRHTVHQFLQKKRELEPDPVDAQAAGDAATGLAGEAAPGGTSTRAAANAPAGIMIPFGANEPADRVNAIKAIAGAAVTLRKLEPFSPAPFLMMRGLRWGELRAALNNQDMTKLEGPPTDLRQHIKRLAIEGKWSELLEATENCMSLPCSRGWLDLQKFTVDACAGLGAEYSGIALAIRGELRTLVRDVPQVVEINLLDDSPAANAETKAWLLELLAEIPTPAAEGEAPAAAPVADNHSAPGWRRKFADSYDLAQASMRAGDPGKAVDIMTQEVAKQLSGRGQFFRKLQLVEICIAAGKTAVAQPIIDDLAATIETNHLDAWEDPKTVAKALVLIMKNSEKVQADDAEKQRLFQKIVRLDPVQAVNYLGN